MIHKNDAQNTCFINSAGMYNVHVLYMFLLFPEVPPSAHQQFRSTASKCVWVSLSNRTKGTDDLKGTPRREGESKNYVKQVNETNNNHMNK